MAGSKRWVLTDDGTDQLKWIDDGKGKAFQIKVSDRVKVIEVCTRDADPDIIEARARVVIGLPIAVDFTLFQGKDGKEPFGRFKGKTKRGSGGKIMFYQDAPLLHPKTGNISFGFTEEIEKNITKALREYILTKEEVAAAEAPAEESPVEEPTAPAEEVPEEEQPPKEEEPPTEEEPVESVIAEPAVETPPAELAVEDAVAASDEAAEAAPISDDEVPFDLDEKPKEETDK